jgi:hypothetical protein
VTCFSRTKKNLLPASLCFAGLLPLDEVLLRRSAEMGYPLAQARMAYWTSGEERFRFSKIRCFNESAMAFFGPGSAMREVLDVKLIWTRPENAISSVLNLASFHR